VLHVDDAAVALLAALMLRGPQTPGELRIATERLHRFADIPALERVLHDLATRPDASGGPLAVQLPRAPGSREQRWAHLLAGPVAAAATHSPARAEPAPPAGLAEEVASLKSEVEALKDEVARLRSLVENLREPAAPRE
jgi:uncharacterized protein YceH (UPF0502 family)